MKIFKTLALCLLAISLTACSKSKYSEYIAVNKDVASKFSNKDLILSEVEDFILLDGTKISDKEIEELSHIAHEQKKCGGFTQIENGELESVLKDLKDQRNRPKSFNKSVPVFKESILELTKELSTVKLKEKILFLQNQGTRSARGNSPNVPINRFADEIRSTLSTSRLDYTLDKISHNRTNQNSLRVRIKGFKNPEKIVVLGGHVDSTTSFFSTEAPGADDNASGSAAVLEVLRVLAESKHQPDNTIEFFWYAGEEQGLIGSKEIASEYKDSNKDVIAVMQLDMILYPGSGDKIGLVTDYTDPSLTDYVEELVNLYLKTPVIRFDCGYGCSDHASWHQKGYPAVTPFEATINTSNKNIHTPRDVFDSKSDINHALKFTKLALAYVFEKAEFN